MSVARTLIKLREFQTNSADTLAYANEASMGSSVKQALDWIFAVLYPNTQASVATTGDLPAVGNTINDYRIVLDDGDAKAAGYRWEMREGDLAAKWYKIHDMDWSNDSILAALMDQTQQLYVSKYGREDQDANGVPLSGLFAGQNVYGGTDAGSGLTLHANAGDASDAPEDQTGYIQFHGNTRPTYDVSFDLGTATKRFQNIFFGGELSDGSINLSLQDILDAFDHSEETTGNPHNTGYDDLSNKLGTLTLDGDVDGSVSLGSTGNKTITVTVVDDSHTHDAGTSITGFETEVYNFLKASLVDVNEVEWVFDDINETIELDFTLRAEHIENMDGPVADKILVGNPAGDEWRASSGLIELLGDATGSATYNSTTDKWEITVDVASSSLSGIAEIDLTSKAITSISVANPSVITRTAHGLRSGDKVRIFGSVTTPNINNTAYTVTVIDANTFSIPVNVTASTTPGYFIPTGGQLLYNPTTGKFEVAKEFEEIRLGELSGLTEDVLSIYAAIGGRTSGQEIIGGVSSGENLTLDSTSNVTKGSILIKSKLTPNTTAAYSGGWTGTDLGSATKLFNDIYMAGEAKGLRVENLGSLPSPSGTKIGRLLTYASKLWMDTGAAIIKVGSGDVSVVTKTANYTATDSDDVILVNAASGNVTITFPTAVGFTKLLRVKKIDSSANLVIIDGNGSETLDEQLTQTIYDQHLSLCAASDNVNWRLV